MSNTTHIIRTKFVDLKSGEENLGVRIFDDYEQSYSNNWKSIPTDDLELLTKCIDEGIGIDTNRTSVLNYVYETQSGIFIDDTCYEWEVIQPIFAKTFEDTESQKL